MKVLTIQIAVLLILGGCISLTEDQIFESQYALVEAQMDFDRKRVACKTIGGSMVIFYRGIKSKRGPRKRDYDSARCKV